jgi:SAM-dependent methyltransferase
MTLDEKQQLATARATWSAGDYDSVAEYIWSVGEDLVGRIGIGPGDAVLDVACGTGNAAIPAARAGATVTGLDLTPEMFEGARRRAAEAGVAVTWVEGDCQHIPYDEGEFDVVLSTFGCMFAPDHGRAARELVRVLKPGGRLGVAAWTPDGSIGRFFAATSVFAPPPPPGAQPPVLWGDREHVRRLFAEAGVDDVECADAAVQFEFPSLDWVVSYYTARFGPLVMLRRALEPEGRWPEALAAIRRSFAESNQAADGSIAYPGEYLVTLGTKRAA